MPSTSRMLAVAAVAMLAAVTANTGIAVTQIYGSNDAVSVILAPALILAVASVLYFIIAQKHMLAESADMASAIHNRMVLTARGIPPHKQRSLNGRATLYPDFERLSDRLIENQAKMRLASLFALILGAPALCIVALFRGMALVFIDPAVQPIMTALVADLIISLTPWLVLLITRRSLPTNIIVREQAELWWRKNKVTVQCNWTPPEPKRKKADHENRLHRRASDRTPEFERAHVSRRRKCIKVDAKTTHRSS